jgi:hypothetical protein
MLPAEFSGRFRLEAGVVEWQTRGTQNALAARLCGFESRSRH